MHGSSGGQRVFEIKVKSRHHVMRGVRPSRGLCHVLGVHAIMWDGGITMSLESMLASLTPEEKLNAMDILCGICQRILLAFPRPIGMAIYWLIGSQILLACLDFRSVLLSMMSGSV